MARYIAFSTLLLLGLLACRSGSQAGPSVSLTLSPGAPSSAGDMSLDVTLNNDRGAQPATVQWTFVYRPSDISQFSVTADPRIAAAGKRVDCRDTPGKTTCLVWGMNRDVIPSGLLARAGLTLSQRLGAAGTAVSLTGVTVASPEAKPIMTSTPGSGVTLHPRL